GPRCDLDNRCFQSRFVQVNTGRGAVVVNSTANQRVTDAATARVVTKQGGTVTAKVVAVEPVVQDRRSFYLLGVRHRTGQSLGVASRQTVVEVVFYGFFGDRKAKSNSLVGVASGPRLLRVVIRDSGAFRLDRCSREAGEFRLLFKATLGRFGVINFLVLFAVARILHAEEGVEAGKKLFKELGT
ncbi:MAG: hypothetical protein ACK559_20810, partial [bacterium]